VCVTVVVVLSLEIDACTEQSNYLIKISVLFNALCVLILLQTSSNELYFLWHMTKAAWNIQ